MTFTPERLTQARERRMMTKAELAEQVGKTPALITRYENGSRVPPEEAIALISRALRFPGSFFFRPAPVVASEGAVSFRALASMTAARRRAAISAGALAAELSDWIADEFELPSPHVPDLRGYSPEDAAAAVRAEWQLGQASILNVVKLLESKGIRLFSLVERCRDMDAFSHWRDSIPFVFLNMVTNRERCRFNAAHELGHLVLHRDGESSGRIQEREADSFASAFLMPQGDVVASVPFNAGIGSLLSLKSRWGVSLSALVYRANSLNLFTEWHHRNVVITLSKKGWRTTEPNPMPGKESSEVLTQVLATLRSEGKGAGFLAAELDWSVEELSDLVFNLTAVQGARPTTGEIPPSPSEVSLRLVVDRESSE